MELSQLHQLFLQSNGVSTDTRDDLNNKLFFALKGPNFNANTFARQALEKGALACIIDEASYQTGDKTILVKDVLSTLQDLANYHRKQSQAKFIALTGSNGKTTTKELLHSVLSLSYKVQSTKGNLNNHIGVPLTLLSIKRDTEIAIIEMGANNPKEIAFLSQIAEPDWGLITNIGKAHLEGFGSIEGVDTSKRELFDFISKKKPDGSIFININDPYLSKAKIQYEKRIEYGDQTPYSFKITQSDSGFLEGILSVNQHQIEINSQLIGSYNSGNLLAVATIATQLDIDLETIKKGIESYTPANSRSQLKKTDKNKLILDAYNANPTSVEAAVRSLISLKDQNKFAILGEMKEGGKDSVLEHKMISDLLFKESIPHIFIGDLYKDCTNTYTKAHFSNWKQALENPELIEELKQLTILIKGSRSVGLENLVPHL